MSAHLRACRERQALPSDGRRRPCPTFGIAVRSTPTYWLHVEVRQDATFRDLDHFLRLTWLECCGHLSQFTIQGVRVAAPSPEEADFFDLYTEESMSFDCRLRDLLFDGAKFQYEYDFGSTTRCTLRVTAVRTAPLKAGEVWLLARNDPPRLVCDHCGALATAICTECIWDEEGLLCTEHLATHACGKDMCLPVVNSPRTGVCAYSGGAEDPDS